MIHLATTLVWFGFIFLFVSVLALDLGVLHRDSRVLSIRQALAWTALWVLVALLFGFVLYGLYEYHWLDWHNTQTSLRGSQAFIQYITGYVLEWSLSVDNIFVIALVFSYMKIPAVFQYRVLFWGIVGAIILRGAMIALGAALIHSFAWMSYVFGVILLISALRMMRDDEATYDPNKSVVMRAARRMFPVTETLAGHNFFTRIDGRRLATPLFVTLLFVDFADVLFAVDSIPAIFSVTQDSFIVFTSNAFAILGMRSLYFAIVGLMAKFRDLKISLIFILLFIAVKLLIAHYFVISNVMSLSVIVILLGLGMLSSLWRRSMPS